MLVAAMNPTPDGKMPHESHSLPREIQNYLGRISGPLLDRIDLHIEVPQVKFREIAGEPNRRKLPPKFASASSPPANASKRVSRTSRKSPATPAWARAS